MWKLFPTALALVLATTVTTRAQRTTDTALVDGGRDLFATYCASCHGITGRGNGPVAEELRQSPADLTQFAPPWPDVAIASGRHPAVNQYSSRSSSWGRP